MPDCSTVFLGDPNGNRARPERRMWAVLLLLLTAAAPQGDWLTENRDGVIRIAPCGAALCGRIIGMTEPGPDVRGEPKCGLEIIHALRLDDAGTWHGRITDPDSGRRYSARITPREENTIALRGALDVPLLRDLFGSTQLWTRYAGPIGAACLLPKQPPGGIPGG